MQSLMINLPPKDAEFLRAYADAHRMSLEEVFDRFVQTLRRISARPVDSELSSLVGILPKDADIESMRMAYLAQKYLADDGHH